MFLPLLQYSVDYFWPYWLLMDSLDIPDYQIYLYKGGRMAKRQKIWSLKNCCFCPKMLISPFLGKNSYFCISSFSNFKPICHLFTSKLGNLGHIGRLKVTKKVKNSTQNIVKVARTLYVSILRGLSPGSICRFCSKVVQMCSFARSSTSRDPFGRTFSAGLILKKPRCAVGRSADIEQTICLPGR